MSITYRGEKFSGYNKPKRTPGKSKKFAVLAKEGDKVRLVRFGDPNMSIKKNIPAMCSPWINCNYHFSTSDFKAPINSFNFLNQYI